jgi:hypothetical protein
MRTHSFAIAIVFGLSLTGGVLAEDQCPKGSAPIFEDDLKAVPDCIAAHKLHDTCAWGSSGDAGLSQVVIDKCEAGFLSKLDKAQKRVYDARSKSCEKKYTHETDSMSTFQTSMCLEGLAATYFSAAASGPLKQTPRWKAPAVAN